MSIKHEEKKVSPNEMAKIIIDDYLDQALGFWFENWRMEGQKTTEAEEQAISLQVAKKIESIRKSLGMEKMFRKIENR